MKVVKPRDVESYAHSAVPLYDSATVTKWVYNPVFVAVYHAVGLMVKDEVEVHHWVSWSHIWLGL